MESDNRKSPQPVIEQLDAEQWSLGAGKFVKDNHKVHKVPDKWINNRQNAIRQIKNRIA